MEIFNSGQILFVLLKTLLSYLLLVSFLLMKTPV